MGIVSRIRSFFIRKPSVTKTTIQPTTASVKSTDYTTGEYKTIATKTTPATPTAPSVTTTTITRGGGRSTPTSTTTTTINAPTPTKTETITPSSISPAPAYTGELPPQPANKGLLGGIKGTIKAVANVGAIGKTQSLSGYTGPIMESFKAYPGTPKAYDVAPNPLRFAYSGTGIGTNYDFPIKQQTYYDISEANKAKLWGEAGLTYTGEPTSLIPTRVGESIVAELKPKYQAQVDAGTLDVDTANVQFQTEAQNIYASRTSGLNKKIGSQIAYEQSIFTPPAYNIASTSFKVAETGALIGASAFGGSGLTLATSAYLGARTFSSGVNYVGNFDRMSTGEKILGGAGLGLGALATGYTFKLGTTRFYGEWRSTIYEGLESQKGRITGKELFRGTDELGTQASFFKTSVTKVSGVNTQVTKAGTAVWETGTDRLGFFQKGATRTRIFDPQYEKFVTTNTMFTQAGNIPKVSEGISTSIFKGGFKATSAPEFSGGFANVKYFQGDKVINYGTISSGKLNQAGYYDVFAGGKPYRPGISSSGVNFLSTGIRSKAYDFGKIMAYQEGTGGTYIISSGGKSSLSSTFKTSSVGSGLAFGTTLKASTLSTPSLASSTLKQSYGAGTQTLAFSATKTAPQIQAPRIESSLKTSPLFKTSTTTTQILETPTKQKTAFFFGSGGRSGVDTIQQNKVVIIPAITPATSQQFKTSLRTGLITPGTFVRTTFTPPKITTTGGAGFYIPLAFNPAGLGKNILTGGKRTTAYTPSFQALVFQLKGKYRPGKLRKSGLDYRPITPAFKIQKVKRI